ncbi:hypothetical protein TrLO_g8180 [Triparma laevis f. longispina]|uniref:Meiosis-specific nuclear structural protein 1 n=1 Tax=Triparma laevis f. longispina TaxID=1714387 RepID=A0A9W7DPF9_9STRA|nr:hypothetical protein TrLO_g8180 [Triparma laevis f. longispina]
MTQQSIEKLEALRRQDQARNSELLTYVGDNTKLSHAAKNEIRVTQARRQNSMARVAAENMIAKSVEEQMDKEEVRRQDMMEQKTVLQKQILDRQVLAVEAREEADRDKAMVEAIVAKINEQDQLEIDERNAKKEETRRMVKFFQGERERKKQAILEEEAQAEAEIKAYYAKLADRMEKEEAEKKAAEAEKKRRWAKVVEESKKLNQSKEEFNLLRDMLWEEELEAKRIADDKERVIKREADKKKMMEENQLQLANKKKMIEEMEAEETRLVNLMLQKFAQDEQNEKDKQQSRLNMKNTYIKNIKGQKEEREKLYNIEKDKELAERDYLGDMEDYRLRVVAEARKRLLAQHAAKLKGFLPKGAVQNEEEAAIVRAAADLTDHTGRSAPLVQMQSGYPTAAQYQDLR